MVKIGKKIFQNSTVFNSFCAFVEHGPPFMLNHSAIRTWRSWSMPNLPQWTHRSVQRTAWSWHTVGPPPPVVLSMSWSWPGTLQGEDFCVFNSDIKNKVLLYCFITFQLFFKINDNSFLTFCVSSWNVDQNWYL